MIRITYFMLYSLHNAPGNSFLRHVERPVLPHIPYDCDVSPFSIFAGTSMVSFLRGVGIKTIWLRSLLMDLSSTAALGTLASKEVSKSFPGSRSDQ
jgi:hypothetical protein